jgi:3-hydroxyacyl-CoA dehydrogenase
LINKESLDNFNQNLKVYDSLETVVDDKTFVIEAVVERFDIKKDIFATI